MTVLDIITNALIEINAIAAGETPGAELTNYALSKYNRMLDNWNAEQLFIIGTLLFQGTLTPNHNPHTIGTSGADFTVTTARPTKITDANLILTDVTPNISRPMRIVDDAWWMKNPVPSLATQVPYYLWPNYNWPLGQLYLWPVPTVAYDIQLDLDVLFKSMLLSDTFTMPPAYEDCVTLTLAESCCLSITGREPADSLVKAAKAARSRVKGLNSEVPDMACDGAVQSPDSNPQSSIANFLSGFFN